jgi:hypothetical protein
MFAGSRIVCRMGHADRVCAVWHHAAARLPGCQGGCGEGGAGCRRADRVQVLEPTDDEVQLPLHACVRHALCMWQRVARALCLLVNKNYFNSFPFFG